jgi:hypothetical protein
LGYFLGLILSILQASITLVRELRALRNQRPFLYPPTKHQQLWTDSPLLLELEARKEPRDMIEFQEEIERLFHKNQLVPRIKHEFAEKQEVRDWIIRHEIDVDFGISLLAQMVLHRTADLPTLVGILRPYMNGNSQHAADQLERAAMADLVDWSEPLQKFIIKYDIAQDVKDELERFQYPMPMVVEPLELTHNGMTGYLTGKGNVILKDNYHEEDICLDHLNKCNRIRYVINMDTATKVHNSWKNLDKPKEHEDVAEYKKRVKAFDKYSRTVEDVFEHLGIATGGEFYLTHKYDKRGRTYCQGYHINYQGTPWNKAVIEFADGEIVSG